MKDSILMIPRAAHIPSRHAKRTLDWWIVLGIAYSMTLGPGCSNDLSCVETATCQPDPVDGGPDISADGPGDAAIVDRASEPPLKDVASDSPQTDSKISPDAAPDQFDGRPSDVAPDTSNSADTRGRDTFEDAPQDANDARDGAPIGNDASTPADVARDAKPEDASKDAVNDTSPPRDTSPPIDQEAGKGDGCITNLCGGCGPLLGSPGARCGSCGVYVCSVDKSSVTCDNDTGLNDCGGCGALTATPGAKCGACGTYVCSSDRTSVTCDHPDALKVTQLAAGDDFTCALLATGRVRCWGGNAAGQLGDGTVIGRARPPEVDAVANVSDFTAISAGYHHVCALRANGDMRCWGANASGQLGNGTTKDARDAMGPDVLGGVGAISATGALSCALLASGSVRCWGANRAGELGDGTSGTDRWTPNVDVSGLTGVASISGPSALQNGAMWCWGGGTGGTLGDGLGIDSSVPVKVLHLSGIASIAGGQRHTCAIASGGVHCWGYNGFGQCGDGRAAMFVYEPNTTPVLVGAIAVAIGLSHTCAVLESAEARCWGYNYYGEVGDGTTSERLTPVRVSNLAGVTAIATGSSHNCALLASGAVRCWGFNSSGQLGDNSLIDRSTPVDVPPMCP
jgi:alpha-tubulin suppressor-like RCC1 family protein